MLSPSDWLAALALVFGGCCSNAVALERLTSECPRAGILVTFLQFLVVSLYALPAQLVLTAPGLPRLRQRRVPLLPYLLQVALFFALSTLNNAAFAYDIPMTVHIVFRSGGMIVNMLLGSLFVRKRYTLRQVLSVLVVTAGIVLTTLSASNPKPPPSTETDPLPASRYAQGVALLALALLLSGFLGLVQDAVYARYILPTDPHAAADPLAQPSWQENMFYLHALALPLFVLSRESIATELERLRASPAVALALPRVHAFGYATPDALVVPSMLLYLAANTATQLLCVVGVNRLTGRVSSLTVTLILTVRKAVSLLLSVAVYGRQSNPIMWSGAALVFAGTIGYSTGPRSKPKNKKE